MQPALNWAQVFPAKVGVQSQSTKFGSKWNENQPFGLKIGPNEWHGLSGPIWTTQAIMRAAPDHLDHVAGLASHDNIRVGLVSTTLLGHL